MFERHKEQKSQYVPPKNAGSNDPVPNPTTTSSVRTTAMIGPTINIKGDVTGDENLVIEGKVEGKVDLGSKDVTVGASGQVKANIFANIIKVEGEVNGDMTGAEKVVISKTGKVQGNIEAPRVTLEDGAKFKGSIDMDPAVKASSESPVTSINASKSKQAAEANEKGEKSANANSG